MYYTVGKGILRVRRYNCYFFRGRLRGSFSIVLVYCLSSLVMLHVHVSLEKVRRRSAFRILFSRQLIAGAHIRADVYDDDGLSCMHAEVAQLPDDPGSLQFCARKLGRRRCVAAAET